MAIVIVSNRVSDSARALREALRASGNRALTFTLGSRSGYPAAYQSIINWGSSSTERIPSSCYNPPANVAVAANKLRTFTAWNGVREVNNLEFCTNPETARSWIAEGKKVYCRTRLTGHSGEGIVVADQDRPLQASALYTKGVDIAHEFRFHVVNGVVIDGVRKAFDSSVPEEQWDREVRNHSHGSIFVRSGRRLGEASRDQDLMRMCTVAVRSLGLDFGAVDIIKDRQGVYWVVEVNTACGLTGTTLERYHRAMLEMIESRPITPWSMEEFNQTNSTQTQEEQEEIVMTINTQTVNQSRLTLATSAPGAAVTFSPEGSSNISTLTVGTTYEVERTGATTVYVRNDQGSIRAYQPNHFLIADTSNAVPLSSSLNLVGTDDGKIDTTIQPPTNPLRVVKLSDGSSVNATGTATFNAESRHVPQGEHTICELRAGKDSGDVFLGIQQGEHVFRFLASNFSNGSVDASTLRPPTAAELEAERLRVADSTGALLTVGDNFQITQSTGGHGLTVGEFYTVATLPTNTKGLRHIKVYRVGTGGSTSEILPTRGKKVSDADKAKVLQDREALASQATETIIIGTSSYRVPANTITNIQSVVRRYVV